MVDNTAGLIGQRHHGANPVYVRSETAVQRQLGGLDQVGRGAHRRLEIDIAAIDLRLGAVHVALEPRNGLFAPVLRDLEPGFVTGQLEVVADETAERTGNVSDSVGLRAIALARSLGPIRHCDRVS
jgi:hypothetical protein